MTARFAAALLAAGLKCDRCDIQFGAVDVDPMPTDSYTVRLRCEHVEGDEHDRFETVTAMELEATGVEAVVERIVNSAPAPRSMSQVRRFGAMRKR